MAVIDAALAKFTGDEVVVIVHSAATDDCDGKVSPTITSIIIIIIIYNYYYYLKNQAASLIDVF